MRISKDMVFEGLPATTARQLMRKYQDEAGIGHAEEVLTLPEDQAVDCLERLCAAGYLEELERNGDERRWITTVRGNALAQATFRKPISRATAERHLMSTIERAKSYNSDPSKLLTITSIVVFGSFLDIDQQRLGDLDLAVEAVRRVDNGNWSKQARDYARRSGRRFPRFIDELGWPARELITHLKGGSPAISITTEDVAQITDRYRAVYNVTNDIHAIQPPPDAPKHPF